jgi:hypothetical protein
MGMHNESLKKIRLFVKSDSAFVGDIAQYLDLKSVP